MIDLRTVLRHTRPCAHWLVLLILISLTPSFSAREELRIGYITGSKLDPNIRKFYNVPGQQISGAVKLAIDRINNDTQLLPNHRLVLQLKETYGSEDYSISAVYDLYRDNVSVILGPQETCMYEARTADVFDIPMISYHCNDAAVSDKSIYSTFARTRPQASLIAKSVIALLRSFEWLRVTLVYKSSEEIMQKTAEAFKERAKLAKVNITAVESFTDSGFFDGSEESNEAYVDIVRRTYVETRIYVLITNRYEFVGFAAAMKTMGLMESGDYFLVCADGKGRDVGTIMTGMWMRKPTPEVIEAFQSVLVVVPSPPKYPEFDEFSRIVDKILEQPPFNFTTKLSRYGEPRDILPEAAYLYDATILYAKAAQWAMSRGLDPTSGRAIMQYLRNLDYISATGLGNRLDENSDAEGNYTMLYRARTTDGWSMQPVGTFHKHENGSLMTLFNTNNSVDWITGSPPLYEPLCGYYGEKCRNDTWKYVVGVLGTLALILAIIITIIYRRRKYEQDLAKMLWRVDWKDIAVKPCQTNHYKHGLVDHHGLLPQSLRASQTSIESSFGDVEYRHVFTTVALYKGTLVAIKFINKKTVDITRTVQKELKLLKDFRHMNLTQFYGACIDHPHIAILTEYCPKGSLQDVLANIEIKLDQCMITSIVNDLLKGLSFIHASDLHFHGKLKSTNCLIDSRWVIKLTEYGLTNFRIGEENDLGEFALYQSLFWTAPEHLIVPCYSGSQKGDIYSLAIVLYEIYARTGPYEDEFMEPREIIERVRKTLPGDHPFRPRLASLDRTPKFVTDCISECWAEDPHNRPDIHGVKARLKPLQKGKLNIMDNMLANMERYATNLEEVVQERTEQLMEEKKKTDELLLQMLPRSVAEQLKLGKQVEAEAFESVSLYFSDICGFTALSSESTPMQIVDLLNDLYTCFDCIIVDYDAYKVETIGDAYFCVSGLPNRNGIRHAGEIAKMSLHLLSAIQKFSIRHRPTETLKLRIGIHSGACVAGVVGRKMPRYCLFGDAVNTCSRMESTGEPLKIHCSEQCKELLDRLGGYHTEKRGLVPMKGKGEQTTYWLLGHEETPSSEISEPNFTRDRAHSELSPTRKQKNGDKNHNDKISNKLHSATSPIRKFFGRKHSNHKIPIPIVLEDYTEPEKVTVVPEESPLLAASMPNIRSTVT